MHNLIPVSSPPLEGSLIKELHKNGYKVEDDVLADMFESALVQLAKYGYERYEVSNFSRNGKVAKHNKKYWTGANYYGFGLSAHSLINGVRKENTSDLQRYLSGKTLKKTVRLNTSAKKMEKISGKPLTKYTKSCIIYG